MTWLRFLLLVSLAGNLVLWGAWRWTKSLPLIPADPARAVATNPTAKETPAGGVAAAPRATKERPAKRAHPGNTWAELHTEDLPELIDRLRTAGFPAHVVRAIVATAVNERFAARREELLRAGEEVPFWKQSPNVFSDPEKLAAYQRLGRERDRELKLLLGADAAAQDELQQAYQRRRYGDLPPEKMARLQALLADYNELRSQLRPSNRPMTPEEVQRVVAFEKELRADLTKLLTPQELEQYDLRTSPTASQLRYRLEGLRPTEDEYKAIFSLQRAIEEQFPTFNQPPNPQQQAARRAAEQQLQGQLQAALGPERYADYLQATNPSQSALNQLVARLELPVSAAREVVAVQQNIGAQARGILTSDTLTPEQQTAQLQALYREATAKLSTTLGPRGLEAYQQQGGQWLKTLTRPVGGGVPGP